MAEFLMKAGQIDNGSLINMEVVSFPFTWKNLFDVENEPGKDIGSPWNHRAPSFRYLGHEGAAFTIQGIIDSSKSATTTSQAGYLNITLERLGSFTLHGSVWTLYPGLSGFLGSPFSSTATGSVPCVIQQTAFTIDTNYQTGSEYMYNYNMQLMAVSGPV